MSCRKAVERLQRVAADSSTADDRRWLTEVVRTYLDAAATGLTLDQAAGVATEPGRRPWYATEALARRDRLIRDMAALYFADLPIREQADRIANAARRFDCGAWQHEQFREASREPDQRTFRGMLRAGFRMGRFPLSAYQITRILSRSKSISSTS